MQFDPGVLNDAWKTASAGPMFSRVCRIARHHSQALPSLVQQPTRSSTRPRITTIAMAPQDDRATRNIHTAACLIIGDEVLGGKTRDSNSHYMSRYCFSLGINLRRIEVIADEEDEIIEAARRMSDRYDFVVTSGGIGPTHDDITYQSIAKAFNLPLKLHEYAFARMKKLSKPHPKQHNFDWDTDSPELRAKLRMVELPTDTSRDAAQQCVFPCEDLWVPVSVVNGNIHILPGVPRLFEALLEGLKPILIKRLANPGGSGTARVVISTPLPESAIAGYLTEFAAKVGSKGVKVGSYPRWGKKYNTVTLVGKDRTFLDSIAPEVARNVQGRVILAEGEDDEDTEGNADTDA